MLRGMAVWFMGWCLIMFFGHLRNAHAESPLEILDVRHVDAGEIARVLAPQFPTLRITVAVNRNALIVSGPAAEIERLRAILPALDVAPRTVRLTARLMELSETAVKDLGLQGPGFVPLVIREGNGGLARTGIVLPLRLRTLVERGEARATDAVSVTTLSGEVGVLRFGAQFPFAAGPGGVAAVQTGVEVLVRPRALPSGEVRLEFFPRSASPAGITPQGLPITTVREAGVVIVVRSGETAVVGGMDETRFETVRLGPVRTREAGRRTRWVILVTPEVLDSVDPPPAPAR